MPNLFLIAGPNGAGKSTSAVAAWCCPVLVKENDLRMKEKEACAAPQKLWTSEDLEDAVNRAVSAALRRHKELGQSVVIWRDGQIVTLKPDEIEI